MARMSQKELLDEGIGSMLKKVAQTAGGAVGAVGGALKAVSDAGIDATWSGAVKGGVAGAKKGWKATDLTTKDGKLKKYIEDLGYMIKPGTEWRSAKGKKKMKIVDLVTLDYSDEGKPIPGEEYERPFIFKYDKGQWKQITRRGEGQKLKKRDPKNKEEADQLDQEKADTSQPDGDKGQNNPFSAEEASQLSDKFRKDPKAAAQMKSILDGNPIAGPFSPEEVKEFSDKFSASEGAVVQMNTILNAATEGPADKDVGAAGEFGKTPAADPGEATKPTRSRDHKKEYARKKELKAQKAAAAEKEVPKESFSQKNLLRRLHILRS